jgi:hypothetical protein
MKKIRIFLTVIMFMGVLSVMAQTSETRTETPGVDRRERHQRARIREGVREGELTRQEAAQSRRDQRRVHRTEKRAKADGEVTKKERAEIHRKQNRSSRQLRRNKHDDQQRSSAT